VKPPRLEQRSDERDRLRRIARKHAWEFYRLGVGVDGYGRGKRWIAVTFSPDPAFPPLPDNSIVAAALFARSPEGQRVIIEEFQHPEPNKLAWISEWMAADR
jgi:hypothetical protein